MARRFSWQYPVKDKDTLTPPGAPATGDRYLIQGTGLGGWAGKDYNIATWIGDKWVFTAPTEGMHTWVDDENYVYIYDGSVWRRINTDAWGVTHTGDLANAGAAWIDVTDLTQQIVVPTGETWRVFCVATLSGHYSGTPRQWWLRVGDGASWGKGQGSEDGNGAWSSLTAIYFKEYSAGTYTIHAEWIVTVADTLESGYGDLMIMASKVA